MLDIGRWAKLGLDRHNGVAMEIGVGIRNMGTQSTRAVMAGCARAAETIGFESIWVVDHIAIPPDDAEGSGGRYLDILSTLAWLAGITKQVKLIYANLTINNPSA